MDALSVECVSQVAHFVEDTAESPHITLIAVGLRLEEFWGHVVGCADACVCEILRVVQDSGDTEVT